MNNEHRGRTQRLIRLVSVKEKTGASKSSIYKDPTFPRPIKIGPRACAWIESEVDDWIAARIAASRSTATGGNGSPDRMAAQPHVRIAQSTELHFPHWAGKGSEPREVTQSGRRTKDAQ